MMSNCAKWRVEETCQYLEKQGLGEWAHIFKEKKITGIGLREITLSDLEKMGIKKPDDQVKILYCIKRPWQLTEQGKVFNDPIHGHIELHPLLIKIIDTPQFQRLRYIKQLGGVYFVYPGASHNRFEHSIGVGHLAGQLVQALNTRQPELLIDRRDILCVQIAGLCHDLGHGPFSHMFDEWFIPQARQMTEDKLKKLKHEYISCKMFDELVKCNNLETVMKDHGLVLPDDLVFIKEMIRGSPDTKKAQDPEKKWPYTGRPKDKSFLYEIVANKRNGMDVDKFDYFARDCYHLGIQNNFDFRRFLKFARVCEVDKEKQICMRDKEKDTMTEMFHTRYDLHRRACQHRVNTIIQAMIKDAFLKADKYIEIKGSGGKPFTLSTAIDDMEAYTKLTDQVFEEIRYSSKPELAEAKKILERIISRDFYNFLGDIQSETSTKENKNILQWKKELAEALNQGKGQEALTPEDIEVIDIDINYGMKEENPVNKICFYSKQDPTRAGKRKVSKMGPKFFSNQLIRFCCKKNGRNREDDKRCFDQWRRSKGFKDADE